MIALNEANYEDLRELGLSVTQTGRVLAYREKHGQFSSLDELDQIPGFPRAFLSRVKTRLEV
jgi:DNA uptake protein ComE-like DNA-binding protein